MKKISYLNIFNFLKKNDFLGNNYFKITDRNFKISENMVGFNLSVYNGRYFIPLKITENMVGHMVGSFIFSFKILLKSKKKKTIKKKKR